MFPQPMLEGQRQPLQASIAEVSGNERPLKVQKTDHASLADLLTKLSDAQQKQMEFMQTQMMQFQQSQLQLFTQALSQLASARTTPTPSAPADEVNSQTARNGDLRRAPQPELTSIPPELDKTLLQRTKCYKDSVFKLARARSDQKQLEANLEVFNGSEVD
jgi:hypothetical protein